MNEQLQQRLERLCQRIDEAERNGDFEYATELKIEVNAVEKALSELAYGA